MVKKIEMKISGYLQKWNIYLMGDEKETYFLKSIEIVENKSNL